MKINGKTISGPQPEVLVIPKGREEFVFKASPVLDYSEFEKLCPVPQPPVVVRPGKEETLDVKDKDYGLKITEWANQKTSWMALQSLQATEGLEWESVDMADPSTWNGYMDELKKSFTEHECNLIFDLVITACGLNQKKIDEATNRFLAGQGQEQSE